MSESCGHARPVKRSAGTLLCLAILTACSLATPRAFGACLSNPDPEVRQLEALVYRDAAKAVTAARAKLDELNATPQSPPARRAAFYAVLAQAFSILELDREARQAASAGLALVPQVDDPVHISLLATLSANIYDSAGLTAAVANIESARRRLASGSLAHTCLTITLGGLQHRQDRDDLALQTLTHAYHASSAPGMAAQRVLAAGALANVVGSLGDFPQALALNQEVIDWDMAQGAWLDLSVTRFLRGETYRKMSDHAAAVKEFAEARRLSTVLSDRQGIAFADLRLCQSQIELQHWVAAREQCQNALEIFTASQSTDMLKEARAWLAQIDLAEGHARRALTALDGVLDHDGTDMPPRRLALLYKLRAQANAALKQYQRAYADLDEYMRRYVQVNDADRTKQSDTLRTHFETDREIERSATLQRELVLGKERWERQRALLRWTAIGVGAGGFVIVLLTYILFISMRHRKQLIQMASRDVLTGLLNRRRTIELATRALGDATSQQRPLTIAVIDLDHFKTINDRCGHAVGDYVLKEFARIGRESLRGTDVFGRWGGEEFLVVLPDTTLDTALASMERLRIAALAIQLPSSGAGLRVSFSAGLATNDLGIKTLDEVIAQADAALYEAKSRGRDLVRISDESYRMASTGVRHALRDAGAALTTGQFPQAKARTAV